MSGDEVPNPKPVGRPRTSKMTRRKRFSSFEAFLGEQLPINPVDNGRSCAARQMHSRRSVSRTLPKHDTAVKGPGSHWESQQQESVQSDLVEGIVSHDKETFTSSINLLSAEATANRGPDAEHVCREVGRHLLYESNDAETYEEKVSSIDCQADPDTELAANGSLELGADTFEAFSEEHIKGECKYEATSAKGKKKKRKNEAGSLNTGIGPRTLKKKRRHQYSSFDGYLGEPILDGGEDPRDAEIDSLMSDTLYDSEAESGVGVRVASSQGTHPEADTELKALTEEIKAVSERELKPEATLQNVQAANEEHTTPAGSRKNHSGLPKEFLGRSGSVSCESLIGIIRPQHGSLEYPPARLGGNTGTASGSDANTNDSSMGPAGTTIRQNCTIVAKNANDGSTENVRPTPQNLRYGAYSGQQAPQNRNTPLGSGRLQNTTKLGAFKRVLRRTTVSAF